MLLQLPDFFSTAVRLSLTLIFCCLSLIFIVFFRRRAKTIQEYLRRIIEACLVSAREGDGSGARQLGAKAAAGVVSGAVGAKGAAGSLRV